MRRGEGTPLWVTPYPGPDTRSHFDLTTTLEGRSIIVPIADEETELREEGPQG